MQDKESTLSQVLANIAKEQQYNNYETKIKLYESDGANYTSKLYSITLSAPGKDDLDLFAKVAAVGESFRTMMIVQVFQTEIKFYTKTVPRYRELEDQYNFPEEERVLIPKYYGGTTEHMKETLVLEELSVKGYEPFDRFKCYDWEYASLCVSVLARLHALSVAFLKEQPDLFGEDMNGVESSEQVTGFMQKAVGNGLKVTAEEQRGNLAKFFEKYMSEETLMTYYNPKRKIVLIHGDFRPSNVLHKRDENGKLQVVIVDYQVIKKSNPVVDLVYFLISGSDEEFRQRYKKQYFDHYYQEFSTALKRLKIDPNNVYTKEDFDADVETFLPFGLVLGVIALPIITVDVEKAPKLDEAIDMDSFAIDPSDLFTTRFSGLVNDYVKWGYLEGPVSNIQPSKNDVQPTKRPKKSSRRCAII